MSRKLQLLKYLLADFISAITSWCAFFAYRKYVSDLTPAGINTLADPDRQFHTGLFIVPFFWLFLYYISGYYNDVFRKSRLSEIWMTFGNTFIGTIFLFFLDLVMW